MTDMSEEHRHACEVRYWGRMYWRDREGLKARIEGIAKRRGAQAAKRIQADIEALWVWADGQRRAA